MANTLFFEPGTINVYASIMIADADIGRDYGLKGSDNEIVLYNAFFIKRDGAVTSLVGTPDNIKSLMLHPDYKDFKRVSLVQPNMFIEGTKYRVLDNGSIIAQTDRDVFVCRPLNLEERILFGLD